MSSCRFLHLADVHFDTPYLARTASLRQRLREAARTAFIRAVDQVLDEKLDALLIAGDLLDSHRLTLATEHFLLSQLARLNGRGIPVYIVLGNHDPARPGERVLQMEWPENVHLFRSSGPESLIITDQDGHPKARLVGASHTSSKESRNLAAAFPVHAPDLPNIALLHAWVSHVVDEAEHARYAACALHDLEGKGYDYWALGHIHLRQEVSDSPAVHYPGNLQGRHFGETGAKGGLLVECAPGWANATFQPYAPVRWERMAVGGLEQVSTLEQFVEKVQTTFDSFLRRLDAEEAMNGEELLLRLELQGPCPLYRELVEGDEDENRSRLEEILAERLGALHLEIRTDRLQPQIDWTRYRQGPSVVATLLELITAAREGDVDISEFYPAKWAGLSPNADAEEQRRYVNKLLDGVEAEAVARFLKMM